MVQKGQEGSEGDGGEDMLLHWEARKQGAEGDGEMNEVGDDEMNLLVLMKVAGAEVCMYSRLVLTGMLP